MSADTAAVLLTLAAAPAANFFVVYYAVTAKWWRSLIGRALMISALALALLIDISLAFNALGDHYPFRNAVRLSVYALVGLGAWMQCIAIVVEHRRRRRGESRP